MKTPSGWTRLLRRGLSSLLSLSGAVLLCFYFAQRTPGDAFTSMEMDPSVSAATLALLRSHDASHGSLPSRFAHWGLAALHGDLGVSIEYHRPVLALLKERTPATMELLGLSFLLAWVLGLGLAVLPAMSDRLQPLRGVLDAVGAIAAAVPTAIVAVVAMTLAPARWLPGSSILEQNSVSLPPPWLAAGVLALGLLPAVYLQGSQAIVSVSSRSFIPAARAAGKGPVRLLFHHILPNTLDALLPFASISVAQLLVETVIVETLLAWPGIGQLSLDAASQHDLPVVAALVLLTSCIVVAGNLFSDVLQFVTNPRLRTA